MQEGFSTTQICEAHPKKRSIQDLGTVANKSAISCFGCSCIGIVECNGWDFECLVAKHCLRVPLDLGGRGWDCSGVSFSIMRTRIESIE
jgi:hypothetical protein